MKSRCNNQDLVRHSFPAISAALIVTFGLALVSIPSARAQGIITTIAGGGSPAGAALSAEIIYPSFVALDKSGNLYVTAPAQSEVLKIDTSGSVTVVAGVGYASYSGDGGPATSAGLNLEGINTEAVFSGLAFDSSGNLFISDSMNNRIRRVDASTGVITTVAGNGTAGYTGDGGPATSATIDFPNGVAVDSGGNLFITDDGNDVIRRVAAATGVITTVAGTPVSSTTGYPTACSDAYYCGDGGGATLAGLGYPTDVAVDSSGDLFIADQDNNVIRRVDGTTGVITTVAGSYSNACSYSPGATGDGGAATNAPLCNPGGVSLDSSGDLFITDDVDNAIRRVDATTQIITTVAGNGEGLYDPGFSGDTGAATSATLNLVEVYFTGVAGKVAVDSAGDIFIPDISNNRVRRVDGTTGVISTYAGGGSGGDGGLAVAAVTVIPSSLAIDGSGNIFVDDVDEPRVRRIDATTGNITTVAGDGVGLPYAGNGGPATSASLFQDSIGIALDSGGDLFITVADGSLVLRVDALSGTVTTVAGGGTCPYSNASRCLRAGYVGDGGPATSALLDLPRGVAVDSAGDLYICDRGDNRIRRVDATTGIITTVAGTGSSGFSGDGGPATSAKLNLPLGVTLDSSNDIFIVDNGRIRRVDANTGIITTVAGNGSSGFSGDGGPATSAGIDPSAGLAVDALGNIFVADTVNQRIRRVDALSGIINTVAGSGPTGNGTVSTLSGDGGLAVNAVLNYPYGVAVDQSGNLYIGDSANNRVREVSAFAHASLITTSVSFIKQALNTTSAQQAVTLTNTGAASLNIANISASGDFAETNNCPASLAAGQSCTINVTFTPTTSGSLTGDLTITDDTIGVGGAMQTIPLSGTGFEPVVSSPPPIVLPPPPTSPQPFDPPASGDAPAVPKPEPGRPVLPDHPFSAQPILPATASPALRFSSSSLTFAHQGVGTSSGTLSIVVVNTGPDSISSFNIAASGDFTQTNTCKDSVAPGASCTVDVMFKPTSPGERSGTLTVVENGSDGKSATFAVTLTGNGEGSASGRVTGETPAPSARAPE